jgi:hypothetical protein
MNDHDEQYHAIANHPLILPLFSLLRLTGYRRKGNQVKAVFWEKKGSIFRARFLAAAGVKSMKLDILLSLSTTTYSSTAIPYS